MRVEMGKKYKLADGKDYVLLTTSMPSPYPVVGYYLDKRGIGWNIVHTAEGLSAGPQDIYNLVEVHEP
jgi:hypothetical protein